MLTRLAIAVVATLSLVAGGRAASAATGGMPEVGTELVSGGQADDGRYLAAIRVTLPDGWKTYWRNPGDSGIPPSFDWSGSDNLEGVEVRWPAPQLIDDGYGWVIGYSHELVLPLLVSPETRGEPVRLALELDYAVCKDICVPASATLAVDLPGDATARTKVDAALQAVPERLQAGASYGVMSSERIRGDGGETLRVAVRVPESAGEPRLLVEGPEDWYLPVPDPVGADEDGNALFELALPRDADPAGRTFTATGLADGFSFEQDFTVE